jgi:predicted ATP-grasp superfamily ATP-dependent carboligase
MSKNWQKEIDFNNINIKALYEDGKLPDDINLFIRDVFSMGRRVRKDTPLEVFLKDFKDLKSEIESIFDDFAYRIRNLEERIESERKEAINHEH